MLRVLLFFGRLNVCLPLLLAKTRPLVMLALNGTTLGFRLALESVPRLFVFVVVSRSFIRAQCRRTPTAMIAPRTLFYIVQLALLMVLLMLAMKVRLRMPALLVLSVVLLLEPVIVLLMIHSWMRLFCSWRSAA